LTDKTPAYIASDIAAFQLPITSSAEKRRYDTKLWMRDLIEGAAYLPR